MISGMKITDTNKLDCSGVYCITNRTNGKRYIGSAAWSFRKRLSEHLTRLIRGNHHSRHLQHAFNRDGEEVFEFSILLICDARSCVMYEQIFMDHYKSANDRFGYNISPTAGSLLGIKHSPETVRKNSLAQRGRIHSVETKAKMSKAAKGIKKSREAVAKSAASKRGHKMPRESVERGAMKRRGKKHSPESILKMKRAARMRWRLRCPNLTQQLFSFES